MTERRPSPVAQGSFSSAGASTPAPASRLATSFATLDTGYTACALEFHPSLSPAVAVCGTYQLVADEGAPQANDDEAPKTKRVGRALVIEQSGDNDFREIQRLESNAILDCRWTRGADATLWWADSAGQLVQHRLDSSSNELKHVRTIPCAGPMALSLDISDLRSRSSDYRIITSLSNGDIVLVDPSPTDGSDAIVSRWHAHDYEPWTCGFDYWQPQTVWTGGDDCKLKVWDLRSGTAEPVAVNKRFEGGVTAVRSHHLREHVFAVGSYDGVVRLFDARQLVQPASTVDVGGGVWRLKWHPSRHEKLLVAAMHAGCRLVDLDPSSGQGQIVVRFKEHESMAYGADWSPSGDVVGSCSFYDSKLAFWR